jgi:hypothetical protein
MLDPQRAAEIAQEYCHSPAPLERLGWGIGGYVYLSPHPGRVVKVHHGPGLQTEFEVYRRLRRLRLTRLYGLNVPRLLGFDAKLNLLEMDLVSAPYLLDFAGVQFSPPDFSEDVMQHWHRGIEDAYGPNAFIAYAVYEFLAKQGMYYMDFRVSNMKLDGHPGLEPHTPPSSDDAPW